MFLEYYLEGLVLGIPMFFFVGPVLFTLLQGSIHYGFRTGFAVAVGITVSDIVCITITYFGVSQLLNRPAEQTTIGIIGGLILLTFGISALTKPPPQMEAKELSKGHFLVMCVKGFAVNGINPFVFAVWIGVMGLVTSRHGFDPQKVTIVFSGILTVIFGTDTLKAWLAHSIKQRLTPNFFKWFSRVSGSALIGFALYMFWYAWSKAG